VLFKNKTNKKLRIDSRTYIDAGETKELDENHRHVQMYVAIRYLIKQDGSSAPNRILTGVESFVEKKAPVAVVEEAPVVLVEAPVVVEEAPAVIEAPVVVEEAPPVVEEVIEESPVVVSETPVPEPAPVVVVEEAPVVVEEYTPEVPRKSRKKKYDE
jgi:hypothetical protein